MGKKRLLQKEKKRRKKIGKKNREKVMKRNIEKEKRTPQNLPSFECMIQDLPNLRSLEFYSCSRCVIFVAKECSCVHMLVFFVCVEVKEEEKNRK